MKRNWALAILWAAFLLAAFYGSAPLLLPHPELASVPAESFSAQRAMQHVRALAQAPRVVGTAGMEQAAAYVTGVLKSCGLIPEIQSNASANGELRNVVARLPGSRPGQAVLIVSHLDSVSYGAGDNATGAAVLLESACALKAGEPLRNDMILLFEDGEEQGYLGGYAFAATDPSNQTIRRVIGLDTAAWGPVVLLQTTPGNADFIRAYAASVRVPTAFGFFAEADWKISADTSEIQPFYERGIAGLELEDPTSFTRKHTSADTLESVLPGSLQQMGDQVLALAHSLGNADLSGSSRSELSYFTLQGLGLVRYPAGCNLLLVLLAAAGLVFQVGKGIHRKTLTWSAFFIPLGILLAMLIGSFLVGFAGSKLFEMLFPNPNPKTGSYLLPASLPAFLVVTGLVGVGWFGLRQTLKTRQGTHGLALAGQTLWLLLALLTASLLPVGSAIFTIPFFAAVLCGFLPIRLKWAGIVPGLMATVLFIPNFVLAFLGTGLQTLPLVTLMTGLLVELWAEAYSSLAPEGQPNVTEFLTGISSKPAQQTGS